MKADALGAQGGLKGLGCEFFGIVTEEMQWIFVVGGVDESEYVEKFLEGFGAGFEEQNVEEARCCVDCEQYMLVALAGWGADWNADIYGDVYSW